jgi:hypothetical protein
MKKTYFFYAVSCIVIGVGIANAQINTSHAVGSQSAGAQSSLRGNGMCFTPNKGQLVDMDNKPRPDIIFKGSDDKADVYLRKTGVSYVRSNVGEVIHEIEEQIETKERSGEVDKIAADKLKQELSQKTEIKIHRLDVDFVNGNSNPETTTSDQVGGYTNYYYAHCPNGITNVSSYNEVTQKNIYNNIDVKYYGGKQNGLKYDIVVNPGADANQIKLKYSGAEELKIKNGKLIIKTGLGDINEYMPRVYQNINGKIVDVKARYVLHGTTLNFELGTSNPSFPLIIDPWVTYFGGNDLEEGTGITTDKTGNVIFTGYTKSPNFPVLAGYQMAYTGGGNDGFVAKLDAAGNRLWATYYGGTGSDRTAGVVTDAGGNVFIGGNTTSANLPVLAGFQMAATAGGDAFVVKFTNGGTRLWATYYGGNNTDGAYAIAIDGGGNVFITGITASTNFPLLSAYQTILSSAYDAFIVKFSNAGVRLWATYYGGSGMDWGLGIAADNSGNIFVTGETGSANFPVLSGYQMAFSGINDAFVVAFNSAGARLWATYYGGTANDVAQGITADSGGNIYVTGYTASANFPVLAAYQLSLGGGGQDAFLIKLNGTTGARIWATFLGGNFIDEGWSVVCDVNDNVVASGDTYSNINFPITSCAYQTTFIGTEDQYITSFTPAGTLICSSYFGIGNASSPHNEEGYVAVSGCYVYLLASTVCTYPVTGGAFQTTCGGLKDCAVAKLNLSTCGGITSSLNFSGNKTLFCSGQSVNYTSVYTVGCSNPGTITYSWTFSGGTPGTSAIQNPTGIVYNTPGTYDVKLVIQTACGKDSLIQTNYIVVTGVNIALVPSNTSCKNGTDGSVVANPSGGTAPYTYTWSGGQSAQTAINLAPGNYTVTVTDNKGCSSTSTTAITEPSIISLTTVSADGCTSSSGSVTVTPTGGTGAFTYTWSPGAATSQTVNGLSAGTYSVTVKDSKGCSATGSVIVKPPLFAEFIKGTSTCLGCGCKSWIMITASSGLAPYTYSWPGGIDKRYQNKLCPGAYTINVVDKKGCSVNVLVNAP